MTDLNSDADRLRGTTALGRVVDAIEEVIRGKHAAVQLAVACMAAGGHLLIEDNPGTGKTSLAKAMARAIGGTVRRVQFTPDLLPTDVTGVSVFNPATTEFTFREGPAFTNIFVADEINRASPKTQSALLEVMEEGNVTADGVTRPVPDPFMVVATQNPLDFQGTYPLPEVQLDRFAMKLSLGYADRQAELQVMHRGRVSDAELAGRSVLTIDQFREVRRIVGRVAVSDALHEYVLDLVTATRGHRDLRLGVSTRGSLTMIEIGRSLALINGRDYVTPDDIKTIAIPVLAHRVAVAPEAEIEGITEHSVLEAVLASTPVPRGRPVPER